MKKIFVTICISLFALTGCITLFPEQNEKDKILDLDPGEITTSLQNPVPWQLVIQRPTSESALRTTALMIEQDPYIISYVQGVKWTDTLPDVLEGILLNSFLNSGKITGVGRLGKGFNAQFLLQTHIQKFQLVILKEGVAPTIHLKFAFQLVNLAMRKAEGIKIIEVIEQAQNQSMEAIVYAFNKGLHKALSQAMEWVLTTP
jgi:cholesterol transport system auxiliary component